MNSCICSCACTVNSLISEVSTTKKEIFNPDSNKEEKNRNTSICIYNNGATASLSFFSGQIKQDEGCFVIGGLSDKIDINSIIISCPEGFLLEEYKLEDVADSDQKKLVLKANNIQKSDDNKWNAKYTVGNISWNASHAVVFYNDEEYITFETKIKVINDSGINFDDARLQFFDRELPKYKKKDEQADMKSVSYSARQSSTYKYAPQTSLISGETKTLVWCSAKRIAVNASSGLFVGGGYLKKIDGVRYPEVENWISFPNSKEVGLGKSLPSGEVSISFNKNDFFSLLGFSKIDPVKQNGDVTIRMPVLRQSTKKNDDESSDLVVAQLTQESFTPLTPAISAAEYKLNLQNLKNKPVLLVVTVDYSEAQRYSVDRENMKHKINKNGEAFWEISIPAKGTKELRYKLTIKNTEVRSS